MPDDFSLSSTDTIIRSPALNAPSSQSASPRRADSCFSRSRTRSSTRGKRSSCQGLSPSSSLAVPHLRSKASDLWRQLKVDRCMGKTRAPAMAGALVCLGFRLRAPFHSPHPCFGLGLRLVFAHRLIFRIGRLARHYRTGTLLAFHAVVEHDVEGLNGQNGRGEADD